MKYLPKFPMSFSENILRSKQCHVQNDYAKHNDDKACDGSFWKLTLKIFEKTNY